MVRDGGIEAAVDSVLLDVADDAFVGVVFLVFSAIGADLKPHGLNKSLHFLFVYYVSPVLQLQMDPSVTIVFVLTPNGQDLVFQGLVLIFFVPLFCQYIKVDFGKLMAASILVSWNCSRSLATILAF